MPTTMPSSGHPLSPSQLSKRLRLTSGAITYLVERLVSSGHVVRDSDPRDRRRVVLRYAPRGHEVAGAFFGPLGAHLTGALGDHDEADVQATLEVLRTVLDSFEQYATELESRQ